MRRGERTALAVLAVLLAATAWAAEWYDSYERGLKALRRGNAREAVEQLQKAIKDGPKPGDNVLTYSTNRIAFHPYVALARAQLLAGNVEGARQALADSERWKEAAGERGAVAQLLRAAIEKAQAAAATPPPPPPTVAAQATPPPTPAPAPPPATQPPPTAAAAPPPTAAARPATPLPAAAPAQGTLELLSDPPGATVVMDDNLLGSTPVKVNVREGTYQVTLRKSGFADQSFSVHVLGGRTTQESRALISTQAAAPATLAPAPPAAEAALVVFSTPPGAAVSLDGAPMGATDAAEGRLLLKPVTPGPHRLRLTLVGHADHEQAVEVGQAGLTTVRATLAHTAQPGRNAAVAGLALLALLGAVGYALRLRRGTSAPPPAPGDEGRTQTRLPATASRLGTPRPMTVSRTTPLPGRTPSTPRTVQSDLRDDLPTEAIALLEQQRQSAEQFGEFRVLEQLGKGGMAIVYMVERRGERFALKRPISAYLDDPEFLERFLREAEIGRALHHPNIIRIFERGEVDSVPFFTMELVKGQTLSAYLRERGARPPKEAARIISQVAEALDYAHLKGIVHRDLKPSNIMILDDGSVKVMDYGIARARKFEGLTVTGAFLGTPDYVAPETAEGKGTDARSDLYSLGVVFYELLTGKKPFVGETPFATLRKHCLEPPTPPSLVVPGTPREIEVVVLRLLAKAPEDRYPGAEELLIALREYLNRAA